MLIRVTIIFIHLYMLGLLNSYSIVHNYTYVLYNISQLFLYVLYTLFDILIM